MTFVPVVAVAITAAVVNSEHAIDASDDSADARTDSAAHSTADRSSRTVAAISAFIGSAFHTPDHTLRMRGDGQRQNGQRRGDERKTPVRWFENEQGLGLHVRSSP